MDDTSSDHEPEREPSIGEKFREKLVLMQSQTEKPLENVTTDEPSLTVASIAEKWVKGNSLAAADTFSYELLKLIWSGQIEARDLNGEQVINQDGNSCAAFMIAFDHFAEGGDTGYEASELSKYARNLRITFRELERFSKHPSFEHWVSERGVTFPKLLTIWQKFNMQSKNETKAIPGKKRGFWWDEAKKFITSMSTLRGSSYRNEKIGSIKKDFDQHMNRPEINRRVFESYPKTRQSVERGLKTIIQEIEAEQLNQ